ncbi:di-heme-cytochrome C peroxidase [Sinorhizobium fredii]|uniref:Cytochrome-c domain-containing protein n=1 Tax=Rhizobium fredii TaxID=380 RepID=A0A2L0HA65_RHIFR|nr:di-heme-cytochrome C peroxidase [Sinorhizobium fredii]AUX78334.1 cytochrome-c domain-containing protein [Sinorhizobium fredii]
MRLRLLRSVFKLLLGFLAIAFAAILIVSYAPNTVRSGLAYFGKEAIIQSKKLAPPLLANRAVGTCEWLKQNWSDEDRAWVHNASQGTATFPIPYAWFQKLERPEFSPFSLVASRPLISDPNYLERLGFIAPNKSCDPEAGAAAPEGYGVLPVGFAVLKGGTDPTTGERFEDGLGLTCAACHTGRIFYQAKELRIDGAPAMIDIANLERIIGLSVCYTKMFPWRRHRLADALLDERPELVGAARTKEQEAIESRLSRICEESVFGKMRKEAAILDRRKQVHSEEGFGRLDALNRIGNQVFHENLADSANGYKPSVSLDEGGISPAALDANFAAHTAPVSFPPIWDVPHFTWAQYDASISNSAIRNIGEAMGVSAKIKMTEPGNSSHALFSSTVDVKAIDKIETLLKGSQSPFAGKIGFKGLQAPDWEDAASRFPGDNNWNIDPEKIAAGRELYKGLCFECHNSPPRDITIPMEDPTSFWSRSNWMQVGNEALFEVVQKPVDVIGTDPEQARILTERTLSIPAYLGLDTKGFLARCGLQPDATLEKSYAVGLMAAVEKLRDQWIADEERLVGKPMSEDDKNAIIGSLSNCPNSRVFELVRAFTEDQKPGFVYKIKPHYRARPLNGVWATAPYLHNGSVPTLDDLLLPQDDRPKAFCVGPAEFDTERVGLTVKTSSSIDDLECEVGMTQFDVSERGNSNRGHSFEGDGKNMPAGVIGRVLSSRDRENLIAYLKTL